MKQYITLNTTYYITKYFLLHPLFKIITFILFYLMVRQALDVSTYAYCMDEASTPKLPRTQRFVSSGVDVAQSDKIHFYKSEIIVRDQYIQDQARTINVLKTRIEEQQFEIIALSSDSASKDRWLRSYQEQNIDLARALNKAKMKISELRGRIAYQSYSRPSVETVPLLSIPEKVSESTAQPKIQQTSLKLVKQMFKARERT